MLLKYISTFTNELGSVTISIYDNLTNATESDPITFKLSNEDTPLLIEWDGQSSSDSDTALHQIIGSSATINAIGLDSLYNDLVEMQENQYFISIQTPNYKWEGFVLSDGVQKYLVADGFELNITCKDFLTSMKSTSFTSEKLTYDTAGRCTIGNIIYNAINFNNPSSNEQYPIYVISDLFNKYQNKPAVLVDKIRPDSLIDDNGLMDCYTSIEDILLSFYGRKFIYNGAFYIIDDLYIKGGGTNLYKYSGIDGNILQYMFDNFVDIDVISNNKDSFLIGSIEDQTITANLGIQSATIGYQNDDYISNLINPYFLNDLAFWNENDSTDTHTNIYILGNGSKFNPKRIRLVSDGINWSGRQEVRYNPIGQICPTYVEVGDSASLSVSWRTDALYADNSSSGSQSDSYYTPLTIPVYIRIVDSVGNYSDSMTIHSALAHNDSGANGLGWYSNTIGKLDMSRPYMKYKVNKNVTYTTKLDMPTIPHDGYLTITFGSPINQYISEKNGGLKLAYYDIVSADLQITKNTSTISYRFDDVVDSEKYALYQSKEYPINLDTTINVTEKYTQTSRYDIWVDQTSSTSVHEKSLHYRTLIDNADNKDLSLQLARDLLASRRVSTDLFDCQFKSKADILSIVNVIGYKGGLAPFLISHDVLNNETHATFCEVKCDYRSVGDGTQPQYDTMEYTDNTDGKYSFQWV